MLTSGVPEAIDCPKSLKSATERQVRHGLVKEPNVAPLNDFVRNLRHETERGDDIPFFDPLDGGITAELLYLLEAPGAQAVTSGFISRNNSDESAKNFFELNDAARIPRKATIIWNIVPWYIGSGTRIRAAQAADLAAGLLHLEKLLQLLPALRTVVIMGQKPAFAEKHIRMTRPEVAIIRSPHPSPLYVNNKPGNRQNILTVFRAAAELLSSGQA
jgi:uracil-DNA glycosylase